MTINDLKTGMSVITRHGDHYLIIKANDWESVYCLNDIRIVGIKENAFILISRDYNNNLISKISSSEDIMEIRQPRGKYLLTTETYDLSKHTTILWQRKEVVEMTLEQVCKELGKEIKLIK